MAQRIVNGILIAAAVMTIVSAFILIHQYSASKLGAWMSAWISRETLQLVVIFVALSAAWLALFIAWKVKGNAIADRAAIVADLHSLETRAWEGINKTIKQVRQPIEQRLSGIEDRVSKLEKRLAKITPTGLDFAKKVLSGDPDSYP